MYQTKITPVAQTGVDVIEIASDGIGFERYRESSGSRNRNDALAVNTPFAPAGAPKPKLKLVTAGFGRLGPARSWYLWGTRRRRQLTSNVHTNLIE